MTLDDLIRQLITFRQQHGGSVDVGISVDLDTEDAVLGRRVFGSAFSLNPSGNPVNTVMILAEHGKPNFTDAAQHGGTQ